MHILEPQLMPDIMFTDPVMTLVHLVLITGSALAVFACVALAKANRQLEHQFAQDKSEPIDL